jgi:hypothetical protein
VCLRTTIEFKEASIICIIVNPRKSGVTGGGIMINEAKIDLKQKKLKT